MAQLERPRGATAPIVITATWVLLFLLGSWPAIATVFLFDAGPDLQLWGWLVFYGVWGFEALALLVFPAVWILWALTRHESWGGKLVFIVALVPALALIPIVIAFIIDGY